MRNNHINTDSGKTISQSVMLNLTKSSAFHNAQHSKSYVLNRAYLDDTSDQTAFYRPSAGQRQHSTETLNQPQSVYENWSMNPELVSGDNTLPVRKSRLFNRSLEMNPRKQKSEIKRDLSMPPISGTKMTIIENNIYSQYSVEQNHMKYSIDADLNDEMTSFDDSSSYMYDSIITGASITPPPVHILSSTSTSEYVNRKAIIRPLAFRPGQLANSESSPTKPPVIIKAKIPDQKRISPPPVPPHTNRMMTKINLSRVQSGKSGDSSGYYSSRATGMVTGTASSTDISPTFDESVSVLDTFLTGDGFNNALESSRGNDNTIRDLEQEAANRKLSLDAEILSERQRGKILEAALTNSNCKLLDAEGHIIELKKRLSQRSGELNKAMESLEMVSRSLDIQNQKSLKLEKTIQNLKLLSNDRNNCEVRNQSTQTTQFNNDYSNNKLLEQFEEERKVWLDEKYKVLTYQKQIERNFQQLLIKCRRLEAHVLQMKSQLKDYRGRPSHVVNHLEDHDKSSSNSVDSSNRSFFTNISRIEVTEHQSSF